MDFLLLLWLAPIVVLVSIDVAVYLTEISK